MTPDNPSDNSPKPMNEAGRITGVILDPKPTFADIVARPSWILPVVLSIVVGLAFIYFFTSRVGWDRYFHQLAEISTKMQQMEPAQRENAIQMQVKFGPPFGYVFAVIGPVLMALIVGGVVLLMAKLGGGSPSFKQTFAISAWASLPRILAGILAIVVMFIKNPEEFNLQNPLAFFNLGAFMEPPPNSSKFVYSLATSIDLFAIWTILLVAVGLMAAVRKMPFSKALILVLTPWVIWILAASAVAGMFG
ncbi:MAG: Yip1 family protein [Bryobacteraceae bacterium]